jgi:diguanylate cyclase (GGDEF)-like protein
LQRPNMPIDDVTPVLLACRAFADLRRRLARIAYIASIIASTAIGTTSGETMAASPMQPAASREPASEKPAQQQSPSAQLTTQDRRHPLEVLALSDPAGALKRIEAARQRLKENEHAEAARLGLAEANACRVIADWRCQRRGGATAVAAADRTADVYLQVRARIALGRALSRLGDYNNAARVLAEAQRRLGDQGEGALRADILLAYSSISERLGKLDESYRYAQEGLAYAPAANQADMRLRLLRNMAHIASERGQPQEARDLLKEAGALLANIRDPKLEAEIWLELSRSARALDDADTVEEMGHRIGAIGADLENTQLRGLSYETMAYAEQLRGNGDKAYALLRQAADAFAQLKLQHDELRVVRAMVDLQLAGTQAARLSESIARLIRLNDQTIRADRDAAAADFEERLRYAQSDAMLATANARAETQRLRAQSNEDKFFYTLAAGLLALCMLAVSLALYVQQRKFAALMRERGQEMETAIATDFLTTVHSRRFITDAGHAALAKAREKNTGLAVAIVDIDHFKRINDRFGHAVGDEVLKTVAQAMRAVCRDTDTLGRLGGEEFAVVLRDIGRDHALAAAERLRRSVAEVRVHAEEDMIVPTASIGLAGLRSDDESFDDLLIRADRALYRAKEAGRNRVVIDDGETMIAPAQAATPAAV